MTEDLNKRYCCPACDRDIVNRAVERCLYCGELVPQELLFTEKEVEDIEKKHKEKVRAIEEGRKRKRRTETGGGDEW
jgi:hypothetical protein